MVIATAPDTLGSFMHQGTPGSGQLNKTSADVITPGLLLRRANTAGEYKVTTTTRQAGPFAISVISTAPAGALKVHAAFGPGTVAYVEAQGAIEPGALVMSGSRSGTVAMYTAPTASGTYTQAELTAAIADDDTVVGFYVGKTNNNELDGGVIPAAADTDKILVRLIR